MKNENESLPDTKNSVASGEDEKTVDEIREKRELTKLMFKLAGGTYSQFGWCPICYHYDGWVSIGSEQWCYCNEHKKMWNLGHNVFSNWRYETAEMQQRRFDSLGLNEFEHVDGYEGIDLLKDDYLNFDI